MEACGDDGGNPGRVMGMRMRDVKALRGGGWALLDDSSHSRICRQVSRVTVFYLV